MLWKSTAPYTDVGNRIRSRIDAVISTGWDTGYFQLNMIVVGKTA